MEKMVKKAIVYNTKKGKEWEGEKKGERKKGGERKREKGKN